jgi:hypothetical protein
MQTSNRKHVVLAFVAGIGLTALAGILMCQGANQPVKSETQYFVTGEGDDAHLWVREAAKLRCIGHGECTTHGHDHDHKEGGGHEHPKPAPKP